MFWFGFEVEVFMVIIGKFGGLIVWGFIGWWFFFVLMCVI